MTFLPETGDFSGLTVIPAVKDNGISVVVQEGLGGLQPAFIAQTTIANDNSFGFEFPSSSLEAGLWKAKLAGNDLVVTSPQEETMRLGLSCN